MKKCAQCGNEYSQGLKSCPKCGYGPHKMNNHYDDEKVKQSVCKETYGPEPIKLPPFVIVIMVLFFIVVFGYLLYSNYTLSQISWPTESPDSSETECSRVCNGDYIFKSGSCTCMDPFLDANKY